MGINFIEMREKYLGPAKVQTPRFVVRWFNHIKTRHREENERSKWKNFGRISKVLLIHVPSRYIVIKHGRARAEKGLLKPCENTDPTFDAWFHAHTTYST